MDLGEYLNEKITLFIPEERVEFQAMQQLRNTASMPFVHGVAVMPDCHLGMGSTVGSVIATKGAIMPAAVGVDIGCGMIAVQTLLKAEDLPDNLKALRDGIESVVPTGFAVNKEIAESAGGRLVQLMEQAQIHLRDYGKVDKRWQHALGSLGGGNHFIEICLDENGVVWVVLHSGSRGIGNKLAQIHIKVAKTIAERMFIPLVDKDLAYHIALNKVSQVFIPLVDKDLAYLVEGNMEFEAYIEDMLWAQEFARLSREEMMDRVLEQLRGAVPKGGLIEAERINCHHNFTELEHHMGQDMWITRKGAIRMREGDYGVIPGSMGTSSYIVSGLANVPSFKSAPHGAGRRFSRTEARRRFNMDDYREAMKGIECRESSKLIDELPGAYKDIEQVMADSKELVKVEHVLKQVLNVKGD